MVSVALSGPREGGGWEPIWWQHASLERLSEFISHLETFLELVYFLNWPEMKKGQSLFSTFIDEIVVISPSALTAPFAKGEVEHLQPGLAGRAVSGGPPF